MIGSSKPLADMKVLDLGTFVAAPFCATMLAEFGAEVIKIEAPDKGDLLRTLGAEHEGVPLFWLQEFRNKHTVTCNLREPDGQEIIRDFVRNGYNVVVENFRPETLERWSIGYENLTQSIRLSLWVAFPDTGRTGQIEICPALAGSRTLSAD